jgi:DNA-binding XRE family transcriptional regulator
MERVASNNVQKFREALMMSKAELARKAGLSTLTIDRVESGRPCRLDTKRKILLALGLKVGDKDKVFAAGADDEGDIQHAAAVAPATRFSSEPGKEWP